MSFFFNFYIGLHIREYYLTTPDVFLRTEAAKLWVTPTRLVPSTSTIWSFTLILMDTQVKALFNNPSCKYFPLWLVTCQHAVTLEQNNNRRQQGTKQTGSSRIPHYVPNYSGCILSCAHRFPVVLYQTVAWWRDRGDEAQNKIGGLTRTRLSLGHNTAGIHSSVDGMIGQLSSRPGMKLLMGYFSWRENCAQILLVEYLKSAEKTAWWSLSLSF